MGDACMDLIILLITAWVLVILIVSLVNLKLSIALYASYLILVPILNLSIGPFKLSYNFVNIFLLFAYFYKHRKSNIASIDFVAMKPYLFLFSSLFVITLFAERAPFDFSFSLWRIQVIKACIVPLVMWNLAKNDVRSIKYIKVAVYASVCIAGIYGIALTQFQGANPYTSYLSTYSGVMDAAEVYAKGESRLSFSAAAKIQSTMLHPMTWGVFLALIVLILVAQMMYGAYMIPLVLLLISGFNILVSGVRTTIAAIGIGLAYYLLRNRKLKIMITASVALCIAGIAITSNESSNKLIRSLFDVSGGTLEGSSIGMRLDQFEASVGEIRGAELFGNGFGWNYYYQAQYGDHPVLLAFESLVFMVICNSGIVGVVIWVIFVFMLFRLHRTVLSDWGRIYIADAFVVTFIAYVIGTGEYEFVPILSMYHTLFLILLSQTEERSAREVIQ